MINFKKLDAKMNLAMRWAFAMGLVVGSPCALHASDSDGSSDFDGGFLTFRVVEDHGHLAFLSYQVTPATRSTFTRACAKGEQVWVNGQHFPCLASELKDDGTTLQVEIPLDAEEKMSSSYYLVSVQPSSFAALRNLNEKERNSLQEKIEATGEDPGKPQVTTEGLAQARATDGPNRSLIFIPHGKSKHGNRPTYVFSVLNGEATYAGELPNWPEKLINIGRNEAPQVIVNLAGDTEAFQSYTIWPHVKMEMFVATGG